MQNAYVFIGKMRTAWEAPSTISLGDDGFLDAEGIATERNTAAAHMQDESTDEEISGASDYGTLA